MIPYTREQSGNALIDRIQDTLRDLIRALTPVPFLKGKRIDGLVFAAGEVKAVTHGLNRKPTGYLVLRSYGANTSDYLGWADPQRTDTSIQVDLTTTKDATFDVWIF